jgi:triacylglycerol lipase
MNNMDQQIILLHGLGRSPRSMRKIELALKKQGYRVLNTGYNGITDNFEQILSQILEKIEPWINPDLPVHFVGHSFGGILIRGILAKGYPWDLGRCVMLGTPNKGTSIASYVVSHGFLKYFTPTITRDLVPDSELIKNLPEPHIDTGIIAGSKEYNPIIPVSWFYKKATDGAPGDGVVEVSNTECRNMSDFILLPLHHSFMMWDSPLIKQIIHFLQKGCFIHPD